MAAPPVDALLAVAAETEQAYQTIFESLLAGLPPADGVEVRTDTVTGVDGNDITLYIHRPADAAGPLPGLLHLHGGGMAILRAADAASVMTLMASLYDPTGQHAANPLAWPYFADPSDLEGLPPHVVTTDELDPLRDEGLAYLRKLQRAGVNATGHTFSGVPHAGEQLMAAAVPELFTRARRDIADFARGLG